MPHRALSVRIMPYLLVAVGCFCVTIAVLRIVELYTYQPLVFEVKSPEVLTDTDITNVRDGRSLVQTFGIPKNTIITHIGIRLANTKQAAPFELIVSLHEGSSLLAQTRVHSDNIGPQGHTSVPLFAHLVVDEGYAITIEPHGVERGADIAVAKEIDEMVVPGGNLILQHEAGQSDIRGHMSFQLLRRATPQAVLWSLVHSKIGYALAGILLAVAFLCIFWRKLQPAFIKQIQPCPDQTAVSISVRELILAGLTMLIVAGGITWPLYRDGENVSTLGDINRALVYRAVAQQSLVNDGEIALWDPYLCGGGPLLANPESDHLSIFFVPSILLGPEIGLRLAMTMAIWLSSLGMYVLARRYLRSGVVAAFLAGVVFTYSGFQMLALGNGYFAWLSIGLLPWLVAAFLESLRKSSRISLLIVAFSLLLLSSSIHITLYGLIAISILAVVYSLRHRRWQPMVLVSCALLASLLLAAPKLLPMAELQTLVSSFERAPAYIPPVSWFPRMFLDRSEDLHQEFKDFTTGINYRWTDYGGYFGIVPLLLAAGTFLRWKRQPTLVLALWVLAAVSLLITFSPPPLRFVQNLPMVGELLRNPQRLRVLFIFSVALLSATGLENLAASIKGKKVATILTILITLFVAMDLISYHAPLMSKVFPLLRPSVTSESSFVRRQSTYTDKSRGFYRAGYISYLENTGSTDLCPAYLDSEQIPARGIDSSNPNKPYRGEVFLASNSGIASIQRITPNEIVVDVESNGLDTLVLNQTFFPGWKVYPTRETTSYQGLLAVSVSSKDSVLTFQYRPLSYYLGLLFFITTIVVLIWIYSTNRSHLAKQSTF